METWWVILWTSYRQTLNICLFFLLKLKVKKYGTVEELQIFYHPKTNKHLGFARLLFESVKGAKLCVEKLNQTSVMGKPLQVFLDPFGMLYFVKVA